jgi:branched-chain amino acid transport system substrate-binding protein
VADSTFAGTNGGIPADVAARTKVTIATLSPDEYPPEGQTFFKDYTTKYGEANPDPYAIYGYETMALALDAIKRSGTGDRADVIKALFATKDRHSVLCTYSLVANGDTTLTDYGVFSIKNGKLVFDKTIKAQGS